MMMDRQTQKCMLQNGNLKNWLEYKYIHKM